MKHMTMRSIIGGKQVSYPKPNICVHCGIAVDAPGAAQPVGHDYFVAFYQCTVSYCRRWFACLYLKRGDSELDLLYTHPSGYFLDIAPELKNLSPRFADLYVQAADAESADNFDLAACGYRNAVEALVKDYAIKYKGVSCDEALVRKPLRDCIDDYLDGLDEAVSAFMVKEFGNAATHYPQLGDPFDFEEQKFFFSLFLQYITGKIKILAVADSLPDKYLRKFEKHPE